MQLYHFPSPKPQKVTFALKELGLDCEILPVDLARGNTGSLRFSPTTRSAGCRFWFSWTTD